MPMLLQYNKNFKPLAISISTQSVWGPADIRTISDKLGMAPAKVSEKCILSLMGIVRSDQSATQFNTGKSGKASSYYTGTITAAMASVQALCPADTPMPSGKGIINQIDDKYVVPIGFFQNCSPQAGSLPSQLVVLYAGNNRAQCYYQ